MIPKIAFTSLLALTLLAPVHEAAAQDQTLGGALIGGAAGAIVGGAVGGGKGAAIGAIVGAGTGAAIASQGQPRGGGYYAYRGGCYAQQPDGSYYAVSPRYCGAPPPPPPQRVYEYDRGPPPRAYDAGYNTPRCMRSPTYDPRSGTYVARDGYRYACP